jgi:hypothetical protein
MTPTDAELDALLEDLCWLQSDWDGADGDVVYAVACQAEIVIRALRAELDACNPARYRERKRREADA